MAIDYEMVRKYARRGILVDTNILLLHVVGSYSPALVPKFKRTQGFSEQDFVLLEMVLGEFDRVITTPNVLTEVSDLADGVPVGDREGVGRAFIAAIGTALEIHTPSVDVTADPNFLKYGLADTNILLVARGNYLVLTDDFRFSGALAGAGVDVINFNHIRF